MVEPDAPDLTNRGPQGLRAADRAMSLLFALAAHPSGMTLADLSRETGITLTTVHRMVSTLRGQRLTRATASGQQALGPGTLILARGFLGGLDFRVEALPVLAELREATNESCPLGTLANPHIVFVDKLYSTHSVGVVARIGATAPAVTTALGRAILAYSSEATVTAVIESTRSQLGLSVDDSSLRSELSRVRDVGYSRDLGDNEPWVSAVGAPVFDEVGNAIAAISLTVPTERFETSKVETVGLLVRSCAGRISAALGHGSDFDIIKKENAR